MVFLLSITLFYSHILFVEKNSCNEQHFWSRAYQFSDIHKNLSSVSKKSIASKFVQFKLSNIFRSRKFICGAPNWCCSNHLASIQLENVYC